MSQKLPRRLAMPALIAVLALSLALPMLGGCSAAPGRTSVHARQDRDAASPATGSRIQNVDRKGDVRTSSMVFVVDGPSARCILDSSRC